MSGNYLRTPRFSTILIIFFLLPTTFFAQEKTGVLEGKIIDQLGGIIVEAKVSLINQKGERLDTVTDKIGKYYFNRLAAGKYIISIEKTGFALFEGKNVEVKENFVNTFNIVLEIKIEEKVEVPSHLEKPSVDPNNNKDATVLKRDDLDNLPDDPEALETFLKALAGDSAGPDGAEIYIDGLISRNVPPKSSISEIRINRNPFSAEFDRIGYSRIEIITKAGSNKLAGSFFFKFNDESFNARNAFAETRPPFQMRRYGGDISNSFLKERASYFIDIEKREINDSSIVNATVLDEQFRIALLKETLLNPQRTVYANARTDFQINTNNTLSFRYGLTTNTERNAGVGGLSLISQAYESTNKNHTFQAIQTSVIKEKIISELRFQFERNTQRGKSDNTRPSIVVSESFIGGNSQIGDANSVENNWEIGNALTFTPKNHTTRLGFRFRGIYFTDISPSNFGGTLTYTGGNAPRLNENGQIILGSDGQPVIETISSIERYRRALVLARQGLLPAEIRRRGGGASQFSINTGNPKAKVSQLDFSGFINDDWRLHPTFALSFGLRFESQTNLKRNFDVAPQISFAWSPKTGKEKKFPTIIRGGIGVFYSRFSENLVLDAERFNGSNLKRFIITDANILDEFPAIPSVQDLSNLGQPLTIRKIAPDIRAPYSSHWALSVEQGLPLKSTLTLTLSELKLKHALRSRNINAPFSNSSERPFNDFGNVYQYESSGRFNSRRLRVNFTKRFGKNSFDIRYDLQSAKSDTDGPASFPANQFDLSSEYGRSALDIRQTLFLSGYFSLPYNFTLSSFVIANSGSPFNIILGQDTNGDSIFAERPAFASDLTKTSIVHTKFGIFDTDIKANSNIIPRNYGTNPPYFSASLRISRNFKFDLFRQQPQSKSAEPKESTPSQKRFNLNLSAQIWNIFNYTNKSRLIGNLTSPHFGQAISTAGSYGRGDPLSGNRAIDFQMRFSF